ncbi:SulP family inorganic anion transporter [Moraxella atlantae]|uniref:SulP family inorganic anion transporter n=1 Tax=Faucicola atlantae TaxID=34059 RepID=UPI0037525794
MYSGFFRPSKNAGHNVLGVPAWVRDYRKSMLAQDVLAGLVVGVVVIPQSLGYAMLAGLPPVYGLYSAVVPVLVYAWVGASAVNAVGPVAITAIMTAQALQPYGALPPADYARLASWLALLTGGLLTLAHVFRLGWITQFISRGVTAGFISGAALLIFLGQIKFVTGIHTTGNTLLAMGESFFIHLGALHVPTLLVGAVTFGVLVVNRYYLTRWFGGQVSDKTLSIVTRVLPLVVMVLAILVSALGHLAAHGVATVAHIPQGLPHILLPLTGLPLGQLIALLPAAALMALIGFVSSDAVAGNFARVRHESYDANRELLGLGLANIAGSVTQSFTVVGGFSRTAVNVDAGAQSPLASVLSVAVMVLVLVWLAPYLAPLPYAVLGATIMVSIISMVDLATFWQARQRDRLDALAFAVALVGVLLFGLNIGLVVGILVSFAGLIWQSSHPHMAIVGQVGDTGHFRNIERHHVAQHADVLVIRIDESLFYGNAESVRQFIQTVVHAHPACRHVVLMLSAVNHIDLTAQEMLVELGQALLARNISFNFSEVKGPVMDVIANTPVIQNLSGQVFLSTQQAVNTLVALDSALGDQTLR